MYRHNMKTNQDPATQTLLDQIAAISTMERGKLTEEFRTRPAADGTGTICLGPYFKLQAWERGRNSSRRVPAEEVPALREDLANFERFNELTGALAEEIISRTRGMRRPGAASRETPAITAKKNSTKKPARKGMARPKRSSKKPGRP